MHSGCFPAFRHRGAAFEVVDSSAVHVTGCTFDQVGGNGVLFSNAVLDSQVTNSEFVQCGDSAVVSVGRSVGIDGRFGFPTSPPCLSPPPSGGGHFQAVTA